MEDPVQRNMENMRIDGHHTDEVRGYPHTL